jgi:hypothetical protein
VDGLRNALAALARAAVAREGDGAR